MIFVATALVVATLTVMTAGWVRPVVALGVAIVIPGLLGIASARELFSGLSNGSVITVGAMLVIAKGVEQTRSIPARELMLPLAHLTTLTGSITLIGTSSNPLIAGIAADSGVNMKMLSFAPVALPVALAGMALLYFVGPRLLRGSGTPRVESRDWRVEIPIGASAVAVGRTADSLGITTARDYELMEVRRDGDPLAIDSTIAAGDFLVFETTKAGVTALWSSPVFGLSPQRLFEASIKPGETGTLHDLAADEDLDVIAARTKVPLHHTPLVAGATCYVTASYSEAVERNDYLALWQKAGSRVPQPGNTWKALLILALVVLPASFGLAPIEFTAVGGALAMVLTNVITPSSAARALDWNVLGVIAGSVGLGVIVMQSGLADVLADGIRYPVFGNKYLVIVVFAVVTALLTNVIANAAAASILTPVGLVLAVDVGMSPVTLLALIGTCISFTFLTPFSHQTNLMVIDPIGYSTKEFTRFGIPLMIVGLAVACGVGILLA